MGHRDNLSKRKFNRWTVLDFSHVKHGAIYWNCKCECGTLKTIHANTLRNGDSKSCGCLRDEIARAKQTTHGMRGTRTYDTWRGIKGRCLNKDDKAYLDYGGRGVTVCDHWLKFENFFADMGVRPEGLTIDRKDNDGDYTPENCRWATQKEQCNNRRNNRIIEYNGEKKTLTAWAEFIGIGWSTLHQRLEKGWSVERALTTPLQTAYQRRTK